MKCPNCGAEIEAGNSFCGSCGSQITLEMKKEQEQLNKAGCPKCGSTNVSFSREKLGESRGKNGTAIIRSTVGVCKDCGHTWHTALTPKQRKTWLWVLGWWLCFPIPAMILIWRKQNKWDKKKKLIATAIFWGVLLVLFIAANVSNTDDTTNNSLNTTVQQTVQSVETTKAETTTATATAVTSTMATTAPVTTATTTTTPVTTATNSINLIAGSTNDYSQLVTLNAGTQFEESYYVYNVPAATYSVKNNTQSRTQVTLYNPDSLNVNEDGWEEFSDAQAFPIEAGETIEVAVPDGWFIEIHEPTNITLTAK